MCTKVKNRCGQLQYATCVKYEGNIPEWSDLYDERDCASVEETVEDLYNIAEQIKEDIDLTGLDNECLTLDPAEIKPNTLFQILITKICALEETIQEQASTIQQLEETITEIQNNQCP